MYCTNCGAEVSDDYAFCTRCGSAALNAPSVSPTRPWHQTWWAATIWLFVPLVVWYGLYVVIAKLTWKGRAMTVGTVLSVLILVGVIVGLSTGSDDDERVAAPVAESTTAGIEGPTDSDVFDLEVGDCIVPPRGAGDEALELERVGKIACSEPHDGEVIALRNIEGGDTYPGEEAVFQQAELLCPVLTTFYFYPTKESWRDGDREAVCVLESLFDLQVGDCINYPGLGSLVETVERVSCSDTHDAEIIGSLEMPGTDYPGDDAVAEYAERNCPAAYDVYLGPTRETWEQRGDRKIDCLAE